MLLCKNACMRTTLDLPDALFKHLKARAALEGRTLRDLVVELVQKGLTTRETVDPQQRFAARPPVVQSSGPLPVDLSQMSNADLYELMYEDEDERTLQLLGRR
jgi:plasmid stability protein